MKIMVSNNHIVVPVSTAVGEKNAVLDTGAGLSFFFEDGLTGGEVDGVSFRAGGALLGRMAVQKDAVDRLVGMPVDGFLGPSFFEASDVLVDLSRKELTMRAECPEGASLVRFSKFMGLPRFEMKFNGNTVRAAFDTGNRYPFLRTDLVESCGLLDTGEEIRDYNPMLGEFAAKVYEGDITIGDAVFRNCRITACRQYDSAASLVGVDAFLGIDPLMDSAIWFSYRESLISFLNKKV